MWYAEGYSYRNNRETGASAESGNRSRFEVYRGYGTASSNSSAVAGSGIGDGRGYKSGFNRSFGSKSGGRNRRY